MQQGTDLLTQLAQIRERQGKEPLPNPGFIQGFGENDPPSPPPPVMVPGAIGDDEEPWVEAPKDGPTGATHYVAKTPDFKRQTASQARAEMGLSEEMVIPQFKLVVMDGAATYAGHACILDQADQDRIAEIVVKAVKRDLDAQLQTIAPESSGSPSESSQKAKRGRGRPRKHPLTKDGRYVVPGGEPGA